MDIVNRRNRTYGLYHVSCTGRVALKTFYTKNHLLCTHGLAHTFFGNPSGTFYSIDMLPEFWQQIALLNPVVYLVNGFRWSLFGISDVGVAFSLGVIFVFMLVCLSIISWMFKTGYKLKT